MRCLDNRRKFRVHGTISVVCQNMVITAVLLRTRFPPRLIPIRGYYVEFKVHSAKCVVFQNTISDVLLWNRLSPS